jgi:dienelactone hydrolase
MPAPVLLDPGHGGGAREDARGKAGYLAFYRQSADRAELAHALLVRTEIVEQIGADGLRGKQPEDQVCAVFDACLRDLASRYAIDLDRVWVTGLSQTGFWCWQLALTRPDRYAGIAPMGAVTWGTRGYVANLLPVALWVLHGDADAICPVAQPRATTSELLQLGARVTFSEIAGGQHDGSTWSHLHEGLAWLAAHPREPYPKRIARALQTTAQPWCHWIRVDELARSGTGAAGAPPTASVRAEIEGQQVRLHTEGVERLTLCLSRELLDLSQPVRVLWNDARRFERVLAPDFARTLAIALEKADWRATFDVEVELAR